MTPSLINRVRSDVWSIEPGYVGTMFDSIERAAALSQFTKVEIPGLLQVVGSLGVITVSGALAKRPDWFERDYMGMTDYDDIAEAVAAVEHNEEIDKVVFHFDTPGGSVTGCPELASQIKVLGKPTVAFTDSMMCSAGYWLGSQCGAIYAAPSSSVGSIGCRIMHVDQSGYLDRLGIKVSMFGKGKHKTDFSPFRPLSEGEQKDLQASVDKVHGQFKAAVLGNRKVDASVFESKCYDADDAIALGLIDGHADSLAQLLPFLQ